MALIGRTPISKGHAHEIKTNLGTKKLLDTSLSYLEELKVTATQLALVGSRIRQTSATLGGITEPSTEERMGTVNDPRMGAIRGRACGTCNGRGFDCPGHLGHIEFPPDVYIFHPLLMKNGQIMDLHDILCHNCGSIKINPQKLISEGLVNNTEANNYQANADNCLSTRSTTSNSSRTPARQEELVASGRELTEDALDDVMEEPDGEESENIGVVVSRLKMIRMHVLKASKVDHKKVYQCENCHKFSYAVARTRSKEEKIIFLDQDKKEVRLPISGKTSSMSIFTNFVTNFKSQMRLLGFEDPEGPLRWILDTVPVIPTRLIPPIEIGGILEPNPITQIYQKIVQVRREIIQADYSSNVKQFIDFQPDYLAKYKVFTTLISSLMDNSNDALYFKGSEKSVLTLSHMLKGKRGLIRGAISGKRVDFSARFPIIHVPGLDFDEIGIPKIIAEEVPMPKFVTEQNKDRYQKLWDERKIKYYTFRELASSGLIYSSIRKWDEKMKDYKLRVGDKVWVPLENGMKILAGRQPTIHKMSLMAYRVRILEHGERAIAITLPITMLHNADLDGDEMTIHVPQTEDAQKEIEIASASNYIMNEETNKPGIALTFNALLAATHLTSRQTLVPENVYNILRKTLEERKRSQLKDIDKRLEAFGIDKRSGRGVFSMLLPLGETIVLKDGIPTAKEERVQYRKGEDFIITDGVLISGVATKSHIGVSEGSLVQYLYLDFGTNVAKQFINDADIVLNQYIENVGFSLTLSQCFVKPEAEEKASKEIADAIAKAEAEIKHILATYPNNTEDEKKRREIILGEKLNIVSQLGSEIMRRAEYFSPDNPLIKAIKSGAKGDETTFAQISALVGPAFFQGKLLQPQMGRFTAYRTPDDVSLESNGFIKSKYGTGLTPADYVSAARAARESLMDTGVKTAETGYMQRRINLQMLNIAVWLDGTVRDETGRIYQMTYSDGFRGSEVINTSVGGVRELSFVDFGHLADRLNQKYKEKYGKK